MEEQSSVSELGTTEFPIRKPVSS